MTDDIYLRLAGLLTLGLLGVGLAVAGSAIGLGDPVGDRDTSGEFRVSETNVTFSDGARETTAVENLSDEQRVEISAENGGVMLRTETSDPLGAAERERAAEIARANGTVQQYIKSVDDYELEVESVEKIHAGETRTLDVNETGGGNGSSVVGNASEQGNFTVVVSKHGGNDESVTVTREPLYVPDTANVRLYGPDDELHYSLHVNLTTESIETIIDRHAGANTRVAERDDAI